jgi:hypothetical protein
VTEPEFVHSQVTMEFDDVEHSQISLDPSQRARKVAPATKNGARASITLT